MSHDTVIRYCQAELRVPVGGADVHGRRTLENHAHERAIGPGQFDFAAVHEAYRDVGMEVKARRRGSKCAADPIFDTQ